MEHHARLIAACFFLLEILKGLSERPIRMPGQEFVFACQSQAQTFQNGGFTATPATDQCVVAGVEMNCQRVFLTQAQLFNRNALDFWVPKLLWIVCALVTPTNG